MYHCWAADEGGGGVSALQEDVNDYPLYKHIYWANGKSKSPSIWVEYVMKVLTSMGVLTRQYELNMRVNVLFDCQLTCHL